LSDSLCASSTLNGGRSPGGPTRMPLARPRNAQTNTRGTHQAPRLLIADRCFSRGPYGRASADAAVDWEGASAEPVASRSRAREFLRSCRNRTGRRLVDVREEAPGEPFQVVSVRRVARQDALLP